MPWLPAVATSLEKQDVDFEWIVVDAGSTDGSLEFLVSTYANVVSSPDSTIYEAINIGLQEAKGDFVGILNADDRYLSKSLGLVAEAFEQSNAEIVCGDVLRARMVLARERYTYGPARVDELWQTMSINHPAMFARREVYEQIGNYDEQYKVSADYDWMLRAVKSDIKMHHLPKALSVFRLGGTSSQDCTSYEEGVRIHEAHESPYLPQMKEMLERCRKGKSSIFNILEYVPFRWFYHLWLLRKWKAMDID